MFSYVTVQTSSVLLGKAGGGHSGERGSRYSQLGRQQKKSDNGRALWGLREADLLMEPSLSENYIYKADAGANEGDQSPR